MSNPLPRPADLATIAAAFRAIADANPWPEGAPAHEWITEFADIFAGYAHADRHSPLVERAASAAVQAVREAIVLGESTRRQAIELSIKSGPQGNAENVVARARIYEEYLRG